MIHGAFVKGLFTLTICSLAALAHADHAAVAAHPAGQSYSSNNQANAIAASTQALQSCRAAHPQSPTKCELVSLNGKDVITTDAVKARLPEKPHPLYLWRLQANESTIYLGGSIHILKPGFYPLPKQFEDAFAQSDYLVFEVDTNQTSAAEMQALSLRYGRLPESTSLSSVLPGDTFSELKHALTDYGVNLEHFEQFKPNFISQQLAVLALLSVGYDPEVGLENHFRRKQGNRTILQLETVEFQLDLLFNVALPTQVEMTEDMLKQLPTFEETTADLVTAWLAGDDQAFLAAVDAQSGETPAVKAFNRRLIIERNYGMTDTITGYLQQPGTYFVLVGAAHLIGDEGIPALLAKAGYTPSRLSTHSSLTQ